jgi:uracil-DNA glycosylase
MENSRTEEMRKIKDEILNLKKSPLYKYRTQNKFFPVIGEGSHDAKIMFIGEAPGKNEALTGRPFCGSSGKVLDKLLASIKLERKDVYITNIVKDRPPDNRDPYPEEIEFYAPFLDGQINIIKPEVIATLGRFSMKYIMEKFGLGDELQPISKMHGQVFETKTDYGEVKIIPLYHPAVALYGGDIEVLKKDFSNLRIFQ